MSSVLHIWASWARAFRLFLDSNNFFSKPVERSTPSHRYPGLKPNRFGGAVPLYSGYSVRKKKKKILFFVRKRWQYVHISKKTHFEIPPLCANFYHLGKILPLYEVLRGNNFEQGGISKYYYLHHFSPERNNQKNCR